MEGARQMTKKNPISRRQFVGTSAIGMSGLLLSNSSGFPSFNSSACSIDPSTEHFWYRKPQNIPFVDSQNKNMAFAFTESEILFSDDNSHTWLHRRTFLAAKEITFSHIFNNGTVLFATRQKLYLCDKKLESCREVIVQDGDGQDYLPHIPKDPNNPGWYFHTVAGITSWVVDGKEMLVWGNYANVKGGASPINIYYSTDNGKTVKIAYSFGQNPHFTDDGSPGGGQGGKVLGSPKNAIICRHVHSVSYNPAEDAFYACTGDGDRPEGRECHWLRGKYYSADDQWSWEVIITDSLNSRYKAGGLNFVDGQVYWISDANGPEPHDRGIFRCSPEHISDPKRHTLLFNPKYETTRMTIDDGVILAALPAVASPFSLGIVFSPDLGKTWFQYDIKEFGPFYPSRIGKKNAEGWFRLDLRSGWIDRSEYLFLKPK